MEDTSLINCTNGVTTVTVAFSANARPTIWRFVVAKLCSCSTYERFQMTLSHKYLYSAPLMTSVMLRRQDRLSEYFFIFDLSDLIVVSLST